jgi:hypothetical protein
MPPLEEFSRRLEAQGFARLAPGRSIKRRMILAELESIRRLEFLIAELNRYLSAVTPTAARRSSRGKLVAKLTAQGSTTSRAGNRANAGVRVYRWRRGASVEIPRTS